MEKIILLEIVNTEWQRRGFPARMVDVDSTVIKRTRSTVWMERRKPYTLSCCPQPPASVCKDQAQKAGKPQSLSINPQDTAGLSRSENVSYEANKEQSEHI